MQRFDKTFSTRNFCLFLKLKLGDANQLHDPAKSKLDTNKIPTTIVVIGTRSFCN